MEEITKAANKKRAVEGIVINLAAKKSNSRDVPISATTMKVISTLLDGRTDGFLF